MADETPAAPEAAEAHITEVQIPNLPDKMTSVREAARALSNWRNEKRKEAATSAEAPAPAAEQPQPEIQAQEADAGEPEAPPSETPEADAAEVPPVDAPRSWTAEDKEWFTNLPHETQQRIAERERSRELDLNRRQQEAAEKQKALDSQMQAAEQTRQQYENALPVLLQTLQSQQAGEFADIGTMADVENLARNDPLRYTLWDAHQKKLGAVQQEIAAAQQRQQQQQYQSWQQFANEQDRLFAEKAPETVDPQKGPKLRQAAMAYLKDTLGYSEDELARQWNGGYLRDHRVQQLILDALRYREAKSAIAKPAAKLPPVTQRPGVSRGPGAEREQVLKTLEQKLEQTGSLRDAARLRVEQMRAARR